MAAKLRHEPDVQVETIKGGFGEFAVLIDDQKVVNTNRLWYPNPVKVVRKVRALLTE